MSRNRTKANFIRDRTWHIRLGAWNCHNMSNRQVIKQLYSFLDSKGKKDYANL